MTLPTDPQQRLAQYQEAKFGLFIHWGAYAAAGVEASWPIMTPALAAAMFGTQATISEQEYTSLPARFNPVDFRPDEWVGLAREAGMRYIVITAKHHDGFCMFDAPGTDYKITNTPFGRDVCLELAQACARDGMPLGFYYSPPDMHHPGYRDPRRPVTRNWTGDPKRRQWAEYLDYMESHLRKLLTDYGEVSILWFDGLTNHGKYDPPRFHQLIHTLSPKTLINDRLGDGYDFITPEQFIPGQGIPARSGKPPSGMDPGGDWFFRTVTSLSTVPLAGGWIRRQVEKYGEGKLALTSVHQEPYPAPERFQPWETCMTMGRSWAYNPDETDWKPPATLVQNLVRVAARGGNYLLNVGPTGTGTFPPQAVERLRHVGRWMQTNQTALRGTTYTPLLGQPWGEATRRGREVFLHVFDWPADGRLVVENFPDRVLHLGMMNGTPLAFTQTDRRLEISLPAERPDPDASVLAAEVEGQGWTAYSAPQPATTEPQKYLKSQAVASFIINAVLNGLIALSSYRGGGFLPYGEAAVDILITVFIITFLTSWIMVGAARNEFIKGNLRREPASGGWRLRLPARSGWRALVISLACVTLFGGLFLDGLLHLVSPAGVGNWAYILIKTLYTGASGALASALTTWSVIADENRKSPPQET